MRKGRNLIRIKQEPGTLEMTNFRLTNWKSEWCHIFSRLFAYGSSRWCGSHSVSTHLKTCLLFIKCRREKLLTVTALSICICVINLGQRCFLFRRARAAEKKCYFPAIASRCRNICISSLSWLLFLLLAYFHVSRGAR